MTSRPPKDAGGGIRDYSFVHAEEKLGDNGTAPAGTGTSPARAPTKVVGHYDADRAGVSSTAILTAAMRALESQKPPTQRLIYDPYAVLLTGEEAVKRIERSLATIPGLRDRERGTDLMASRTRRFDDLVGRKPGPAQVVLLGPGLDTRAWRIEGWTGRRIYELDFPEVLAYKERRLIREEGHAPVRGALRQSVPGAIDPGRAWGKRLEEAGFDRASPSLWVLEGFVGYLKEPEVHLLFEEIERLASRESTMVVSIQGSTTANDLHQYNCDSKAQMAALLGGHGWEVDVGEVASIYEIAQDYGRAAHIPEDELWFLAPAKRAAGGGGGDGDGGGGQREEASSKL